MTKRRDNKAVLDLLEEVRKEADQLGQIKGVTLAANHLSDFSCGCSIKLRNLIEELEGAEKEK